MEDGGTYLVIVHRLCLTEISQVVLIVFNRRNKDLLGVEVFVIAVCYTDGLSALLG